MGVKSKQSLVPNIIKDYCRYNLFRFVAFIHIVIFCLPIRLEVIRYDDGTS